MTRKADPMDDITALAKLFERAKADHPEGMVTIELSATLVERLFRTRERARELISSIDSEPDSPILDADGYPPWRAVLRLAETIDNSGGRKG